MTTTLTDKRVRSALAKLADDIGKTYAKAFPRKAAPNEFWPALDGLYAATAKKLEVRPIAELDVQATCAAAMVRFRELCTRYR